MTGMYTVYCLSSDIASCHLLKHFGQPSTFVTIMFANPSPIHNLKAINASIETHHDATADWKEALAPNRVKGGAVFIDMIASLGMNVYWTNHISAKCGGSVSKVNSNTITLSSSDPRGAAPSPPHRESWHETLPFEAALS